MSKQYISKAKRAKILEKFLHRCAYCQTSARIIGPYLEIDHIMPEAKGGTSDEKNLASACPKCNGSKSDRVEFVDPITKQTVHLFHPFQNDWHDHFEWNDDGTIIHGKTPIGRATVVALNMNNSDIVLSRKLWSSAGWHPPDTEL